MFYPEKLPGGKISQPVQVIDIMPTVLDLAGIDRSHLLIEGYSLLSLIHGKEPDFCDNRVCYSEEVA